MPTIQTHGEPDSAFRIHRPRPLDRSLSVSATKQYTIGALARELGLTVRALHYYEQRGLLAPARKRGVRTYTRRDRGRILFIQRCQRVGLTLRDISTLIDIYVERGPTAQAELARRLLDRQFRILDDRRKAAEAGLEALRHASRRLGQQTPR